MLAVIGLFIGYNFIQYNNSQNIEKTIIDIPRGANTREISHILEQKGVINDKTWFYLFTHLIYFGKPWLSGEYEFSGHLSPADVGTKIIKGEVSIYTITIPEGLTQVQIAQIFNEHSKLSGEIENFPREGTIFPDSWQYVKGDKKTDLLRKMTLKMNKVIEEVWAERDKSIPLSNPDQLVTLASIIEKESKLKEERPMIASVFYNRIVQNMKLESDPTTIYGISNFSGELNRPLTSKDLKVVNDWNTYQIFGLPKTPINNPSLESLKAAANPLKSGNLFFVADGKGGHNFATNYKDHLKNVEYYRSLNK